MDRFLPQNDELGERIQRSATDLFNRLQKVDVDSIGMPDYCLHYYKASHAKRLFFSIETSAHLLYRSIRMSGRHPEDIILMDYGAGIGTLYLLAKITGCKKVVYNDHLDDWRLSAQLVAEAVNVPIDHYIVGDIDSCLKTLNDLHLACDIITSRNVIEHIYKLDVFYRSIHANQPAALVFSSTTANRHNPAAVLKHILWHRKWEKVYKGKRLVIIERQSPGLSAVRVHQLARSTRGLAGKDLELAIERYRKTGKFPDATPHKSNTCDPSNGVWAEHLLSAEEYRRLIDERLFTVSFEPGFWDTHYSHAYQNKAAGIMNKIIAGRGRLAMKLAPFIYVIAKPR